MRHPNFSKFPTLTTSRLILRKLSLNDAAVIYQLRSDIEVTSLIGKKPFTSLDEATAHIKRIENLINNNECILWGISYQDSKALIGAICLWNFDIPAETVEIGYELLPEFQKKGIMAEAVARILEYGFDTMGAKTIVAFPSAKNPASVTLLEKAGFKLAPGNFKHIHTDVEAMLTYVISK
ncbi:GNAT family N-acetyltransferase [Pedobacter nyackensis]|uniref:Ribosomal-protein-alanine N-acetyltransferase n=1 Tax=Pedobacter nyackensis TaxID=475255 RepID=A0A1W2F9I8_9SPHI|nr:GNAT family N-acetyltransferase [Pedobacter nyackensis]SMD18523.1 ribosomal-protein-alanine N-acetyltransferase [Pedobacter nyackensis]